LCILQGESAITSRRLGSLLANADNASLTLRTDVAMSAQELTEVVKWIRSRRLLQMLAIKMIAPPYFLTTSRERFLRKPHTAADDPGRCLAAGTSNSAGICRPLPDAANASPHFPSETALVPA
jgi:hypothetical protein